MDGTFGGGDLISASLAIMFGGGDSVLHDKEVVLTTSQITGSQTAVFEYDPENEPASGDPPGPWDGYSLFTIDLSGVKDDIEGMQARISDLEDELEACHDCKDEVVAFIQQYIPDYDPEPDECPADELPELVQVVEESVQPALGAKFITENGTYLPASDNLDGYNQVVVDVPTWESCIQTIANKLGLSEPYDCEDITDAIDEHEGYEFPEDTPYEKIEEITGMDAVEVVGNDYYWTVHAVGNYKSYNYTVYPQIDFEKNAFYVATPPANYNYGSWGVQIKVYEKATGDLVYTDWLGGLQGQGFDAGEYCKLISLSINYTAKTMTGIYEETNTQTPVQHTLVTNMSRYITVQSPNPQYRVKNS